MTNPPPIKELKITDNNPPQTPSIPTPLSNLCFRPPRPAKTTKCPLTLPFRGTFCAFDLAVFPHTMQSTTYNHLQKQKNELLFAYLQNKYVKI